MAIDKIQSESINLADTFAFTGTVTGAGESNTPAFAVYNTSSQSIPNTTYTKLSFNSEFYDTDNAFASNKFTVPSGQGGKYFFSFASAISNIADGNEFSALIYKNNSNIDYSKVQNYSVENNKSVWVNNTFPMLLSASDYIEVFVYHNYGSSRDLRIENTFFQGFKVSS